METEPIVCENYSWLAEELPEIEIGGLTNEAALKVLTAYIENCVSRIPKTNREFSKVGGSGIDPEPIYLRKVIAKAYPTIKELADREPGSDFELRLLIGIPQLLLRHLPASFLHGNEARKFEDFCMKRMLENHADQEKAQEPLILLIMFSQYMRGLELQLQPPKRNSGLDPSQQKLDESRAARTRKRIRSALEKIEATQEDN